MPDPTPMFRAVVPSHPGGPLAPHGVFPAPPPPAPRPPAQGVVALAVLMALGRRWRQVVIFGVLLAVPAAAAVWFFMPPPKPTATAKLYAPKDPLGNLGSHPDPVIGQATHIGLIRSQLVLAAALRPPEVANLPVVKAQPPDELLVWLARSLEVSFDGPEIIKISMSLTDGEQARVLVNAVKNAYLSEIHGKSARERKDRLDRLTEMSARADETLKRRQAIIQGIADASKLGTGAEVVAYRQKMALEQLNLAVKELAEVKSQIRKLTLEEAGLTARGNGAVEIPPDVLADWVNEDPEVLANLQQREQTKTQIELFKSRAREPEKDKGYLELTAKLAELEKDQKKAEEKARTRATTEFLAKSKAQSAAQLQAVKQQLTMSKEHETLLNKEIPVLQKESTSVLTASQNLELHRLELKQAEELSTRIKTALTTMTMEQDAPLRVTNLEDALVSKPDADAKKMMFAGIGALAALGLVGGLVGFLEVRQKRVDSPDAVSRGLGLRIVGTVPRPPSFLDRLPGGGGPERWQAVLTEAINCTRTMLLHAEGMSAVRVLQVTSSISGEGKTTLSAHLAVSLALAGRKTLLIDGDMRNPNAHKPFNLPSGPGLCEVLRGELPLDQVIQSTPVAGLQVLPAGQYNTETLQALAANGPNELFTRLRHEYDIVIVDSSPVLPVTDPLLLARHTDGVIVAMLQGVSRLPLVEETNHRLTTLGIRVLGAVVNGTTARAYGYGGSYPMPAKA